MRPNHHQLSSNLIEEKQNSLSSPALESSARAVKSIREQRKCEGPGEMVDLALHHSEEAMFVLSALKSGDDEERLRDILRHHGLDDLM